MRMLITLHHRYVGHGELVDRFVVLDNSTPLAIRDRGDSGGGQVQGKSLGRLGRRVVEYRYVHGPSSWPGAKITVPVTGVKSLPAAAVPLSVAYSTVTEFAGWAGSAGP